MRVYTRLASFLIIVLFGFIPRMYAVYDPRSVENNVFGIHVADTNDLADADALVNSGGGDWGYVTVVIPEGDRDIGKWQGIFDQMRRMHLIPIVRLATRVIGDSWVIPDAESIPSWVEFLNTLNWPIQNRYVVLFNEPNHAKEWGNSIDPEGYASLALSFIRELKRSSDDFFILPAGLDVSAATDGVSLDALRYLERVAAKEPEFLSMIDGWTSHSYPNPGFSGSPWAAGRGTLRSFSWELDLLSRLSRRTDIPIFITETGWVHDAGKIYTSSFPSLGTVAQNIELAGNTVWRDPRVAAVTPFLLSYQDIPFDHFSWKKIGEDLYYPQYYAYRNLPKVRGNPRQAERYEVSSPIFPEALVSGSTYTFIVQVKNSGQAILDQDEGYAVTVRSEKPFETLIERLSTLEPGSDGTIVLHIKTPEEEGETSVLFEIRNRRGVVFSATEHITITPPPSVTLRATLGFHSESSAEHMTVLVYDADERLVHKFTEISLKNGSATIPGLRNIIPGDMYRIVILAPYYLPRQTILALSEQETVVSFKRLLPLDFNRDGTFTMKDVPALLGLTPHAVLFLFFGKQLW